MTAVAARPSWVRPQQQPTTPTPPPALSSDTSLDIQLQHAAVIVSPAPCSAARTVLGASSYPDGSSRPDAKPVADEQASTAGKEALVISQQAKSAPRLAETAAQKLHKPLIFDIDDSFDDEPDAPCGPHPQPPSFSIDIDDLPDLPSAQIASHHTHAESATAHLPSTSALPAVQLLSAAPDSNQRQPAPASAAISPSHASAQLEDEEGFPMAPAIYPMQPNRPSGFSSPSFGCLRTIAMTVPDTPPYSHASHAGSPTGPTWLSPMLTKHQPGQGRQYSPSLLGRPPGMHHMADPVMQAQAAAPLQQPSTDMHRGDGPHTEEAQQLVGQLLPLHLHLPERPVVKPAAASVSRLQFAGDIRPDLRNQEHRQTGQAANQLSSSVQVSAATVANGSTRPSTGAVAAATGVFTDWNSQEDDYAAETSSDAAELPKSQSANVASAAAALGKQFKAKAVVTSDMTCPSQSGTPSNKLHRPEQDGPQVAPERTQPLPGVLDTDQAAAWLAVPQAAPTAARSDPGIDRAVSDHTAAGMIVSTTVASNAAVPVATIAAAAAAGATVAVAATEAGRVVSQPDADSASFCAMPDADDWDWQQSQANLGFHDAFGPSQGFGATQGLSSASTWMPAAPTVVKPAQPPYQAVRSAVLSTGLPAGAAQHQRLQTGSSSAAQREPPKSGAKHVPFSNRRVALPVSKPHIKQPKVGAAAQQQDAEVLPVRRPLPKQRSTQNPQGHTQTHKQPLSNAVSAGKHGASPMVSAPGCFAEKADHLPAAQGAAAISSNGAPSSPIISPRHADTAAATGDIGLDGAITHATSGDCTAASARSTEQTAVTRAAAVCGSGLLTTAVASKQAGNPAAAATGGKASTAAATATSPAPAIFGPHIACSQLHAKKKLCLRLAPRQPETAPTTTGAVLSGAPQQPIRMPQHEQLIQAQHGPRTTACANENHTAQTHERRQHLDDAENTGRTCIEHQAVGSGVSGADDGHRAVLSPTDNKLAADFPETATPAGQPCLVACADVSSLLLLCCMFACAGTGSGKTEFDHAVAFGSQDIQQLLTCSCTCHANSSHMLQPNQASTVISVKGFLQRRWSAHPWGDM